MVTHLCSRFQAQERRKELVLLPLATRRRRFCGGGCSKASSGWDIDGTAEQLSNNPLLLLIRPAALPGVWLTAVPFEAGQGLDEAPVAANH